MRAIYWWLGQLLARALEPDERDAVLGDVAESCGSGLQDVFGLVARRQIGRWKDGQPWVALIVLLPLGAFLSVVCSNVTRGASVDLWLYINNWSWSFVADPAFRQNLATDGPALCFSFLSLLCCSWTCGLAMGSLSRRSLFVIFVNGTLFVLVLLMAEGADETHGQVHDPVFNVAFYRLFFPPLVKVFLVLIPAILGMRLGLSLGTLQSPLSPICVATLAGSAFLGWVSWRFPYFPRPIIGEHWPLQLLRAVVYWPIAFWIVRAIRRSPKESIA